MASGADAEALLFASETATVITGANDTDTLVLRHARGVPDFWHDLTTLRMAGKQAEVIMMSPRSFHVLEAVAESKGIRGWLATRHEASQRSALREEAAKRNARREAGMSDEEKEALAQALAERGAIQKARWASVQQRVAGGVQ